jgi:hypothetical protein
MGGYMAVDMRTRRLRPVLLVISALVAASCGGRTHAPASAAETLDAIELAVQSLGGADALDKVRYLEVVAEGQRFEPGQAHAPGQEVMDMLVSAYRYRATEDRTGDRFRMEWNRTVQYPYPVALDYVVIVDGQRGAVEGKDGVFSPPRADMLAANVATLRKLRWLTSPDLLLLRGRQQPEAVQAQPDQQHRGTRHHVIAVTVQDSAMTVRMFIDAATGLPAKIDTLEDDPILGDALVEVELDDWRPVDGVRWPHTLTHKVAGRPVQTETRAIRMAESAPAPGSFDVPRAERSAPAERRRPMPRSERGRRSGSSACTRTASRTTIDTCRSR